ncbi:uncharacterized protein LOC132271033 [Cornus florida]|uniref:uncharacterized protein LOC132271033 n=1 Tax=Cornus florida TaxID=4283 RepID=UPI0028987B84|nr:uncharacterized protein LOC132271033 [Cornus florida]
MDETDDVVSVTTVSESGVTVGEPTVDETLTEPLGHEGNIEGALQGQEVDEDEGEIMVEVVGSDVFVDGVRDHGDEGAVKEGLEKELGSIDDKGGGIVDLGSGEVGAPGIQLQDGRNESGSEGSQNVAGSSGEQTRVDVVKEAAVVANEEASDKGKELIDGKGDGGGVIIYSKAGVLDGQAQASENESRGGDSSVNAASLHDQTQIVTATGMHGDMESVDGVAGALDDLTPVQNSGIESVVVCSSPIAESSSGQTHVAVEVGTEEGLNHKDEVPADVVEVNLHYSEVDQSSEVRAISKGRNKDDSVHTNAESSNQQAKVAVVGEVGVMNKEEILHSKVEVTGICSVEDRQMMVETAGKNTESHCDLSADPISSPEHTKPVSHSEVATVDGKCSLDSNVEAPKVVGSSGTGGNIGEINILYADSGSSIKQAQVAASSSASLDSKVSIYNVETHVTGGGEVLTTENKVTGASVENLSYAEDQELRVKTVCGDSRSNIAVCVESEISSEGIQVVNGNEVAAMHGKVSDPKVDILKTNDMDGTDRTEDDQKMKYESTCESAGKDGVALADPESSHEQNYAAERRESAAMDLESSGELNQIAVRGDIETIEDKEVLKLDDEALCSVSKIDSSIGNSCFSEADQDPATSVEHIPFVKGENASVMEGEKVSNSKVEVLNDDTGYFQKDEKLNKLTVGGSTERDSVAQAISESSDRAEIDMQLDSSVIDCQVTVQVSSCHASDGSTPILGKVEELKVERMHGSREEDIVAGKDTSVGVDSPPVGNRSASIPGTNSDSFEVNTSMQDEKQETVAQLTATATHTQKVDGDQSINPLNAGEISDQGATDVALSDTVVENTAGSQAALSSASFHNGDYHVSSCDSDFITPIQDGNHNLAVHFASNDISLSHGDQIMETCVPHVVTSNDAVNQAIEVKDGSCEADKYQILCAHAPEAEESKLNDEAIAGSLVVDLDTCLNKDIVWKSQDGTAEENNYLPDESYCMGDDAPGIEGNVELHVSKSVDGSVTGDIYPIGSNVEQGVEVEELYTDAEQVDLLIGQEIEIGEQATNTELPIVSDEKIKQAAPEPGKFVKLHQAGYLLPSENEGEYSVSDLVWGKVRSHPWWPGQIFDPADASEKAMKYYKKDCFLVSYFGDRTFAWNDASLLKPFWTHFSQIEKQSNSEAFQNAVSCALEEVSRRVELGLACSCIREDAYDKIESQIVENTGIRQESSRRYGVDKSMGVSSFEPDKLVEFVRALAQSPSGGADRLELVIVKAQLLAFSRLKGYYELPEIQFCGGLLENETDASESSEVIEHATPVANDHEQVKGKPKIESSSSHKRKHNLKDSVYPNKKERALSELMVDIAYSPDSEDGSDGKGTGQSVSQSSGKKRKAVDSITDGSAMQDKRVSFYAAKVSHTTSPIPKPSFKIGECISRVASQLTGSPSILKCSSSDRQVGFDGSLHENSQKGRIIVPTEHSSLDEILSQLHLAARDPMKGYSFLNTITYFFSGFRNSIVLGQYSGKQNSSMGKMGGGRKKKASHAIIGSPEEFEFDDVNDSYWTDMIVQNNPEEEPSGISQNQGEYQLVAFEPDKSLKRNRRSYSRKRYANGHHEMTEEEPIGYIDERKQDLSPTELLLNFTEGDPVPSEMNLNKMFRRFGPLRESETEVDNMTSRARVVFKRCSDAEVAFNSAGKFNIFGPMIVNYQLNYSPSQLNYSPSILFKTVTLATTEDQDDAM